MILNGGPRPGGQSLPHGRGAGVGRVSSHNVTEPIQLKPAAVETCSSEEWQQAIDLLAEMFAPLLGDPKCLERRAA